MSKKIYLLFVGIIIVAAVGAFGYSVLHQSGKNTSSADQNKQSTGQQATEQPGDQPGKINEPPEPREVSQ